MKKEILKEMKVIIKKYPNSARTPKKEMDRYYRLRNILLNYYK